MTLSIQSRKRGIVNIYTIYFDDQDWELIKKFKWSIKQTSSRLYAHTFDSDNRIHIDMHRLIMGYPQNKEIDHRDGNGLNNRRNNLRLASHSQNLANREKMPHNTSGYKGVFKSRDKYRAQIKVNGKQISFGGFDNKIEAAMKYNELALKYFGEFARLNEI